MFNYEKTLSNDFRKELGIFYSPNFITQYIVNQVVERWFLENNFSFFALQNVKILDISCGAGAFLLESFHCLRKIYRKYFPKFLEKEKFIIENNLFGVDLDEKAVEVCRKNLLEKSGFECKNIRCGDSIISDKNISKKPFDWEKEFFEIFNKNLGFDIIVGNPPYVSSRNLKKFNKYFSQYYFCYSGKADLYVYFFEKSLKLLKNNGFIGFITSSKFTKTDYGKNLRQLLSEKNLCEIIDFTNFRVFKDATVASCILILKNNSEKKAVKTCFVTKEIKKYQNILTFINKNHFYIDSGKLSEEIWFLSKDDKLFLKEKIEKNSVKLKNIDGISYYVGIVTSFNEAFIIEESTKNALIQADSQNAKIIKPILRGRDIKKWFHKKNSHYILATGYDENIPQNFPTIFEHLQKFEGKLKKRSDKGENWWNLRSCNYYSEFEKEKIVWASISHHWNFAINTDKNFVIAGYSLVSENIPLKYLLCLLNSKLMQFYFQFIGTFTPLSNSAMLRHGTVSEFPMKIISEEEQKMFIELADKILFLHKNLTGEKNEISQNLQKQIDEIESKINFEIYKIYHLTSDEIKIIEKS